MQPVRKDEEAWMLPMDPRLGLAWRAPGVISPVTGKLGS